MYEASPSLNIARAGSPGTTAINTNTMTVKINAVGKNNPRRLIRYWRIEREWLQVRFVINHVLHDQSLANGVGGSVVEAVGCVGRECHEAEVYF